MATRKFQRGTCVICGHEVSARHYFRMHGIRLKDYFAARGGVGAPGSYTYYCRKDNEGMSGLHEGMAHLAAKHPELLRQEHPANVENEPEGPKVDPEWALANATVGGVFQFLLDARRKAEAEAAGLQVSIKILEEKLKEARGRVDKLALDDNELRTQNRSLREEIKRVLEDNKAMNKEMLRIRNGAKSATEFREIYGEAQSNRR